MFQATAEREPVMAAPQSRLMRRILVCFVGLALLSLAISVAGRYFGASIAMAGYTDDPTVHEIVIGNNVIAAPANTIRFERARRDGIAARLDFYLRWPQLDGYSEAARNDFNNGEGRRILFLALEPRAMSRDMTGRLEPIYRSLIMPSGEAAGGGVTLYPFTPASGYLNEVLAVAKAPGKPAFVARCLSGPSAADSLAPCERDVHVGEELSLSYRFPRELLQDWAALDEKVVSHVRAMLKTAD